MNGEQLMQIELDKINSRNKRISDAFEVLKQEMKADAQHGSLAHAWHCNIAMSCADAMQYTKGRLPLDSFSDYQVAGNEAASRFMKMCFDVKTAR